MSNKQSIIPSFPYAVPDLDHVKAGPYIDFPLVFNEIVTERPFYVDGEFTWVCSESAAKILKWNGNSFTEITSYTNPDVIEGRGFFAVTTSVAAYCTISELRYFRTTYKAGR